VGGQQQKTSFSQAMQDVVSMIQNYAGQIQAGSYPSLEGQSCHAVALGNPRGSRPQIGGSGSDDCISLGRAFQVQPGSGTIYSYPVLGLRTYTDSTGATQTTTSVDQASPEAITNNGLFDTYSIGAGARVVASNSSKSTNNVIGVFTQLEGSIESGSGNQVVSLRIYPYPSSAPFGPSNQVSWCLEEISQGGINCTAPVIKTVNQWTLCMTDGSQTAALEVNANPSGLTAKANFSPSAAECI